MIRHAASLVLIAASLPLAAADRFEVTSSESRVLLVELYTSEGCSSCPPADRWISTLESDRELWTRIVPVAFHVDYWDYIGWKDRFASPAYSERQRAHRREGHTSGVYTPGVLVGGNEWRSWYGPVGFELIESPTVGRLEVAVENERVEAGYVPTVDISGDLELNVVLLGFDLTTAVAVGENSGRRLEHDFVVLGHERLAMRRDGGAFRATGALPKPSEAAPRTALAAWVSPVGDPLPIQATGGWLPR